jgi:hypothetical protein
LRIFPRILLLAEYRSDERAQTDTNGGMQVTRTLHCEFGGLHPSIRVARAGLQRPAMRAGTIGITRGHALSWPEAIIYLLRITRRIPRVQCAPGHRSDPAKLAVTL